MLSLCALPGSHRTLPGRRLALTQRGRGSQRQQHAAGTAWPASLQWQGLRRAGRVWPAALPAARLRRRHQPSWRAASGPAAAHKQPRVNAGGTAAAFVVIAGTRCKLCSSDAGAASAGTQTVGQEYYSCSSTAGLVGTATASCREPTHGTSPETAASIQLLL